MKKWIALFVVFAIFGGIVFTLMSNKAKITANVKTDEVRSYPVEAIILKPQMIKDVLNFVGTIVAINDVSIVSETQGRVTKVMVDVGNSVKENEQLVQVDDELKYANFTANEANFQKLKKEFMRMETLYKKNLVPDSQVESAQTAMKLAESQYIVARRQYQDTKITTPIKGQVTSRLVEIGTMVQPGMVIANVVDISLLKVKINVNEQDVFKMHIKDKVEVTTDVYPEVIYEGHVFTMSVKADEAHTYPVEILLVNKKDYPLNANMFGRVTFVSQQSLPLLAIPREALVGSLREPHVYVIENNVAKFKEFVAGSVLGTLILVKGGLKEGDQIITSGQNNLRDGINVSVISKKSN